MSWERHNPLLIRLLYLAVVLPIIIWHKHVGPLLNDQPYRKHIMLLLTVKMS